MHIGLDASRATVARRTGTEAYALNLIRALLALNTPHTWELYFRDEPAPDLFPDLRQAHKSASTEYGRTYVSALTPPPLDRQTIFTIIQQRRLWTHLGLARRLHERPPDCLFVPAHVLPIYHPCPSVVTVHDLGYLHFPDAHPFSQRLYLDWSTRFAARAATALLADSAATKADLITHYRTPPEKIHVVYPGFDSTLKPVRHPNGRWPVRQKYNLPEKFILHVGTLQPRKNLERLIEAFDPAQLALVLVGRRGWLADSIYEKGQAKGVHFLDYVAEEDLAALYSMATVYVAPSLHEGFGFTVLEAMACGTAVICSDGGSLPEVAGGAALIVPAKDTAALAQAITRVAADDDLRRTLIMQGYRNLNRFSWNRAAKQTLEVIEATDVSPSPSGRGKG
jgi:glycosyltransferase involved in cell wall biosynthesis